MRHMNSETLTNGAMSLSEGHEGLSENDWQISATARVNGTVVRLRHACAKLVDVNTYLKRLMQRTHAAAR
jgi:hypothetical protein